MTDLTTKNYHEIERDFPKGISLWERPGRGRQKKGFAVQSDFRIEYFEDNEFEIVPAQTRARNKFNELIK